MQAMYNNYNIFETMLRLVREINAGLSKLRWFGSYVGDAFVADQFNDQNDLPELHNPSERGLH